MKGRKAVGIVFFVLMALFGLSAVVMWLWNFALVPAIDVNQLSFWQAMALLVLSKILFGGFKGRPGGGPPWKRRWKSKWSGMKDEEKERFRHEWKKRCEERNN